MAPKRDVQKIWLVSGGQVAFDVIFQMGRLVTLATILALCGLNSADAVGETETCPSERTSRGPDTGWVPEGRAEEALRAVGNADCCTKQIHWLFEQNKKRAEEGEPKKMSSSATRGTLRTTTGTR